MTYGTDLQEAQRILREVFHYGDNSYLELALTENDLMDATSWMYLTNEQISSLTFTGDDGAIHPLHPDDYLMLLVFKLYVSSQLASGTHFDAANVSCDDFDMFVRSDVGAYVIQTYRSMFTVASVASVNQVKSPKLVTYGQPVDDNYDTRAEISSSSSSSHTDPICLEDNTSDTAEEASTQDDSDVKDESINIVSCDSNETMEDVPNDIAIEQNIEELHIEDNESTEIVFYEMNESTDVFNESFAESFVAATTPFFRPDTDYGDYGTGSVLEPTNVNMPIDKVCRHLTLDPGEDQSIIGKVEEPMVQEDTLADDADSPMDILPYREAIDCVLSSQMINPTPAAVEISPAVQGLTLNGLLSRHYVKSMVYTMDWNTKDSTSGKSSAICEVLSYSSASDTCSIHCDAQVEAYSGAMVVYQPNDGLVNKALDVVEIVDKSCSVNVACSDGHNLCLSVMTGARIQTRFDPVIVIALINALIDQGSTDRTVCRHEAFDHRIYDKGKISSSVNQSVVPLITNVKWELVPQIVHTSPTEWNTSTMTLELVSYGKYWIDALNDKVINLLKGILTLRGEYERQTIMVDDSPQYLPTEKEDTVVSKSITKHSEPGDESFCSMNGWFPTHINMEIVQQMTHYVVFTGSSIVKKCSTTTCPITNVFRRIGLFTMMCAKQLVFTTKNLCERGAMSKVSLNRTSSFASSWLLAMGYVCLLMNHAFNVPIRTSSLTTTTCPNPHLCPELVFTWWEPVYQKVNNLNFPHKREHLGQYVDIAPNIGPTMTDTMDVMRHFDDFTPICAADGEHRHRRLAPTDGESIRKHVKFRNSFVLHVAKDRSSPSTLPTLSSLLPSKIVQHMSSVLCRDHASMKRCRRVKCIKECLLMMHHAQTVDLDFSPKDMSHYGCMSTIYEANGDEIPAEPPPLLMSIVMVNHVNDWKIFNNSQSDPGSSRDFSCCARIDIDWTSCPKKPCQVKHQANVGDHNSQSDPGSSRDLSCCDRIDIEWPHALMQTSQDIFHMSHAMCSISIMCELAMTKMMLFIHFDGCISPDHILREYWSDQKIWVNIQSKIFHPGDANTVSTIFKCAQKVGGYFVVEDEVFVKKEKINIEDKFVFELKKMKINEVICFDSKGRGVLDFPKVRITFANRDSFSHARLASAEVTLAPPDGGEPFLSKAKPTWYTKRAIVMNRPNGGAVLTSNPHVHDVVFDPTMEVKEHMSQHAIWGEQQCHCVSDTWNRMDFHGGPWISGFQWISATRTTRTYM